MYNYNTYINNNIRHTLVHFRNLYPEGGKYELQSENHKRNRRLNSQMS